MSKQYDKEFKENVVKYYKEHNRIIKRINQNKVVVEGKSSVLDMIREVVSNLARAF